MAVTLGCKANTHGAKFSSKMACANAGVMGADILRLPELKGSAEVCKGCVKNALKMSELRKDLFRFGALSRATNWCK